MTKTDEKDWGAFVKWGKSFQTSWRKNHRYKPAEYVVTILINLFLLAIWGQLPQWLPFITQDFYSVLVFFYLSFAATIAANAYFLIDDSPATKGLVRIFLSLISLAVMFKLYEVFPFDFSAYTSVNWELILRLLMLVGFFGIIVAIIAQFAMALAGVDSREDK